MNIVVYKLLDKTNQKKNLVLKRLLVTKLKEKYLLVTWTISNE